MIKSIFKLFLPKPETMANIAAETICKSLNECEMIGKIADYSRYADQVTQIQQQLVDMLADGKFDKVEEGEIAKLLTPMFKKVIELI